MFKRVFLKEEIKYLKLCFQKLAQLLQEEKDLMEAGEYDEDLVCDIQKNNLWHSKSIIFKKAFQTH